MSGERSIQDIWADTDKPLIERMRQKTQQLTIHDDKRFTSSEESSDSDSDSSSRDSYRALPTEFRPSQTPAVKRKEGETKFNPNKTSITVPQKLDLDTLSNTPTAKIKKGSKVRPTSNNFPQNSAKHKILHDQTDENFKFTTKPLLRDRNLPQNKFTFGRIAANLNSLTIEHENKFPGYKALPMNVKNAEGNGKFHFVEEKQITKDKISSEIITDDDRIFPTCTSLPADEKGFVENNESRNARVTKKEQNIEVSSRWPIERETPCLLSTERENSPKEPFSKKVVEAVTIHQPSKKITFEVVHPENENPLDMFLTTGIPKNADHNVLKMGRNPATLLNSTRFPPQNIPEKQTSKSKNKPTFECIMSEEIQISQTKIIEFDFKKKDNENSKKNTLNNVVQSQKLHSKMKKKPRHQENNNLSPINYKSRNKYYSNNKSSNFFKKQCESVKWHGALNLNMPSESIHDNFSKKLSNKYKLQENSKDKIKWTVIHEEKRVDNEQDTITKNKYSIYEISNDNEIDDFNSIRKNCKQLHPSVDKLQDFKFNNSGQIMNSAVSNVNRQLNHEYNNQDNEIKGYCSKNNLKQDQKINKNTSQQLEINLSQCQRKQQEREKNCDISTGIILDSKIKGHICMGRKQKFSQELNGGKAKCNNLCKDNFQIYENSVTSETLKNAKSEDLTIDVNNALIQYGRDISDLIIGSYTALSTFFAFYNEWKAARDELIDLFQQLEKSIKNSSEKYKLYQDIPKVANNIAMVASSLPLPYVGFAAKIVSIFSSLMQHFISKSNADKVDVDETRIAGLLLQDINASDELYIQGLQCNLQLEETSKLIEKFHAKARNCEFSNGVFLDKDIQAFIQGMLDYEPRQNTFYKKLHKCFQELLARGSSLLSRKFCEPFKLNSMDAVDVVGYLDWRFHDFNNVSVSHELEDIQRMIQNDTATSMTELAARIKNCVRVLKDELRSCERCVSKVLLFYNSVENSKVNSK